MGLLSSSSSTAKTELVETSQNAVDNRVIESGSAVGGNVTISNTAKSKYNSASYNITTTDFGALDVAQDISERALEQVGNAVAGVQEIAGSTSARLSDTVNRVTDTLSGFASEASGTDQNKTVQYFIMAAALVGAVWAWRRA